jgi:hypothetical protein
LCQLAVQYKHKNQAEAEIFLRNFMPERFLERISWETAVGAVKGLAENATENGAANE